mmetsp:Transcript_117907/g.380554  ORF Transcript_117907/g.380554 Transcript_117907/m.380554 type:complete len:208 (-) Transcript_117907:1097-1720(-)
MSENLSWSEKSLKGFMKGSRMTYIIRDISNEPRTRRNRSHKGTIGQLVLSCLSLLSSSSAAIFARSSASWASFIHSPASISSLNSSRAACVYWAMSINPAICWMSESSTMALERPSKRRFATEFSGKLLACTMKEPDSVKGAMRQTMGSVPSSISRHRSRRMPVSTEVGQSGPQHSTATLSAFRPGWLRMCLTTFIAGVWMETSFFT